MFETLECRCGWKGTSADTKTYYGIEDCDFCPSCGERLYTKQELNFEKEQQELLALNVETFKAQNTEEFTRLCFELMLYEGSTNFDLRMFMKKYIEPLRNK